MLASGSLQAANTFFEAGDLILYFQKPGNNNTVYVSLGSAASLFRGAEAGPTADRQSLNLINISTTLTDAFGSGWASDTGIYAGAAAALSNQQDFDVVNGDVNRTMYISRARNTVGTVGLRNSGLWDLNSAQSQNAGSTNIVALGNNLEVNTTTQQAILTVDLSTIDNQNPINSGNGIQGQAFAAFTGGVQQRGSATTIGDFGFGGDTYVQNAEFALDISRIVPRADDEVIGEVSGAKLIGSFEGTLIVGADGGVSFVTIPEPSSVVLSGLATIALVFRRRRDSQSLSQSK